MRHLFHLIQENFKRTFQGAVQENKSKKQRKVGNNIDYVDRWKRGEGKKSGFIAGDWIW